MITIKELKDLILHFDKEYDDFKVILWDYNHQQELDWGGVHAFSKPNKTLSFAVEVPPVDGITVFERLKKFLDENKEYK